MGFARGTLQLQCGEDVGKLSWQHRIPSDRVLKCITVGMSFCFYSFLLACQTPKRTLTLSERLHLRQIVDLIAIQRDNINREVDLVSAHLVWLSGQTKVKLVWSGILASP